MQAALQLQAASSRQPVAGSRWQGFCLPARAGRGKRRAGGGQGHTPARWRAATASAGPLPVSGRAAAPGAEPRIGARPCSAGSAAARAPCTRGAGSGLDEGSRPDSARGQQRPAPPRCSVGARDPPRPLGAATRSARCTWQAPGSAQAGGAPAALAVPHAALPSSAQQRPPFKKPPSAQASANSEAGVTHLPPLRHRTQRSAAPPQSRPAAGERAVQGEQRTCRPCSTTRSGSCACASRRPGPRRW